MLKNSIMERAETSRKSSLINYHKLIIFYIFGSHDREARGVRKRWKLEHQITLDGCWPALIMLNFQPQVRTRRSRPNKKFPDKKTSCKIRDAWADFWIFRNKLAASDFTAAGGKI